MIAGVLGGVARRGARCAAVAAATAMPHHVDKLAALVCDAASTARSVPAARACLHSAHQQKRICLVKE